MIVKKFKDHVENLVKDKNDLIIIVKNHNNNKIDFIKLNLKVFGTSMFCTVHESKDVFHTKR